MAVRGEKFQRFVSLLTHHQSRIHSYILSLVPNFNDAGDIMQETSKTMWLKFEDFEPGTDFLAWGIAIARLHVLEHRRRQRRKKEVQFSDQVIELLQGHVTRKQDRTSEYMVLLKNCFQELSHPDKDLILMRYYENLRVKEMAVRLGKSLRSTYRNLARVQDWLLICVERSLVHADTDYGT